jgi:hypothetical protein
MSAGTETESSWLGRLLHTDVIPLEALAGSLTPELAWEHWAEDRARETRGLGRSDGQLSSAEAWEYQRFDHAYQQERGALLGASPSKADVQTEAGS